MKTKIEISTSQYQLSHRKPPRRTDHGYWGFALSKNPTNDNIFWFKGTIGDAKKAARAHFTEALNMANPTLEFATVYLLP